MKKALLLLFFTATAFLTKAQVYHPVHWSYAAKRLNKTEAIVLIKADIESPWHIYSTVQHDGGPIKTSFAFSKPTDYELAGNITEPRPITKYEDAFKMNVLYFEHSAIFQQKIKLNTGKTIVKGSVKFMCCNDKQCLAPEVISFSIPVK